MSNIPSYKEQFKLLTAEQKKIMKKIPHLDSIDGWLYLVEATKLFELSNQIKNLRPIICEIGVWKGKSSYVLASGIKKNNGTLYSIDPFNGEGDKASIVTYKNAIKKLGTSLFDNFKNTMTKYGLLENIKIFPMQSKEARLIFPEQKIDLLFIDGNHEYSYVKKDYDLWAPLIPSGGTIILHDVLAIHVDGPKRVFQEILNSKLWKNTHIVGEMGVATKI